MKITPKTSRDRNALAKRRITMDSNYFKLVKMSDNFLKVYVITLLKVNKKRQIFFTGIQKSYIFAVTHN